MTWHVHDPMAEKQPGQGSDSGLPTDAMSCAVFYSMAAFLVSGWESKSGTRIIVKLITDFFSICYVLDTVLITSYALLLLLFVIFEGCHCYPHLKKKLGFREHK